MEPQSDVPTTFATNRKPVFRIALTFYLTKSLIYAAVTRDLVAHLLVVWFDLVDVVGKRSRWVSNLWR